MLAFAWVSAGWHCAADGCHDDLHPAAHAGQTEDGVAQSCCDCIGCQPNVAFESCADEDLAPVLVTSDCADHACPLTPAAISLDGPFHPPRA
jgi:hypothetical protein